MTTTTNASIHTNEPNVTGEDIAYLTALIEDEADDCLAATKKFMQTGDDAALTNFLVAQSAMRCYELKDLEDAASLFHAMVITAAMNFTLYYYDDAVHLLDTAVHDPREDETNQIDEEPNDDSEDFDDESDDIEST
jgi:hypothetical protein